MPIRILLIGGSYPPDRCGVGDYSHRLATALARHPDTLVSVLTTGNEAEIARAENVSVSRSIPDWSVHNARRLFHAIRRIRPDIVHVQYPTQGYRNGRLAWLIPLIARCCGARVVQTWHEGFNRRDLIGFLALALTPGRVVVVRKSYQQQFLPPYAFLVRLKRPVYINSAATLPKADLSQRELEAVRERYEVGARRLVVFFGFIHPLKQIEQLFELANPATDYIMVVGNADDDTSYLDRIKALTQSDSWRGCSRVTGFVDPSEAAAILAAADALVLPLKVGGGEWNTSILAGVLQGTFVLTTSRLTDGYDVETNVYYARIDDLDEMKQALGRYMSNKRVSAGRLDTFGWYSIADRHLDLYRSVLPSARDGDLS